MSVLLRILHIPYYRYTHPTPKEIEKKVNVIVFIKRNGIKDVPFSLMELAQKEQSLQVRKRHQNLGDNAYTGSGEVTLIVC